jgi:hypothetical protein
LRVRLAGKTQFARKTRRCKSGSTWSLDLMPHFSLRIDVFHEIADEIPRGIGFALEAQCSHQQDVSGRRIEVALYD